MATAAASVAVAAARSAAAVYSATAAAQWQQRRGCGRFTSTVRDCADEHAFKSHRRADVRIFSIGQGRREDSADGIVVVGSDGGAHEDVHRSRQCAAAANDGVSDDDTADADADADPDANANANADADADANADAGGNDIVC